MACLTADFEKAPGSLQITLLSSPDRNSTSSCDVEYPYKGRSCHGQWAAPSKFLDVKKIIIFWC